MTEALAKRVGELVEFGWEPRTSTETSMSLGARTVQLVALPVGRGLLPDLCRHPLPDLLAREFPGGRLPAPGRRGGRGEGEHLADPGAGGS